MWRLSCSNPSQLLIDTIPSVVSHFYLLLVTRGLVWIPCSIPSLTNAETFFYFLPPSLSMLGLHTCGTMPSLMWPWPEKPQLCVGDMIKHLCLLIPRAAHPEALSLGFLLKCYPKAWSAHVASSCLNLSTECGSGTQGCPGAGAGWFWFGG